MVASAMRLAPSLASWPPDTTSTTLPLSLFAGRSSVLRSLWVAGPDRSRVPLASGGRYLGGEEVRARYHGLPGLQQVLGDVGGAAVHPERVALLGQLVADDRVERA
jgi:hypothetical protein